MFAPSMVAQQWYQDVTVAAGIDARLLQDKSAGSRVEVASRGGRLELGERRESNPRLIANAAEASVG